MMVRKHHRDCVWYLLANDRVVVDEEKSHFDVTFDKKCLGQCFCTSSIC
jgi:hypothetical protein